MITKRIGQRKVIIPSYQNPTKFEKETRHLLYVKKKNPSTWQNAREQHVHIKLTVHLPKHDMLTVLVTVLLHSLIASPMHTLCY